MDLQDVGWGKHGLDRSCLGKGQVEVSCECCN